MALFIKHNDIQFGVGDKVKVYQKIKEKDKQRLQTFEGMVIRIQGRDLGKTFTVRKIGVHQIGIERIFPLMSPTIEKVEVKKKGVEGVRQAKLYYTRLKSKKEIEKIFIRAAKKGKLQFKSNRVVKKAKKISASKKSLNDKKRSKQE